MNKKTVRAIDVTGKRVLVRCDLNVPLDKETGKITDNRSIRRICALLRRAVTVLPAAHIRVHISGIF